MNSKHWALCVGLVGVAGLALVAGLPPFYLLVLACPVMMLGMMAMMPGMHGGHRQSTGSKLDDSHERIENNT